jgi:hypothetical protein
MTIERGLSLLTPFLLFFFQMTTPTTTTTTTRRRATTPPMMRIMLGAGSPVIRTEHSDY